MDILCFPRLLCIFIVTLLKLQLMGKVDFAGLQLEKIHNILSHNNSFTHSYVKLNAR